MYLRQTKAEQETSWMSDTELVGNPHRTCAPDERHQSRNPCIQHPEASHKSHPTPTTKARHYATTIAHKTWPTPLDPRRSCAGLPAPLGRRASGGWGRAAEPPTPRGGRRASSGTSRVWARETQLVRIRKVRIVESNGSTQADSHLCLRGGFSQIKGSLMFLDLGF